MFIQRSMFRYLIPSIPLQVLVLGTGNSRFLDVGVVWREHDPHSRPGYHTGSVGYHGNGDVLDAELSSAVDGNTHLFLLNVRRLTVLSKANL